MCGARELKYDLFPTFCRDRKDALHVGVRVEILVVDLTEEEKETRFM